MKYFVVTSLLSVTMAVSPVAVHAQTDNSHHAMPMQAHTGGHAGGHMAAMHGKHGAGSTQQAIGAMPVSTDVHISECWIRLLPTTSPSAAYFIIKNNGSAGATLVEAASPYYGMVMMHQTTMENGMSRMSSVDDILVPAGQQLAFKPGAHHLMLEKPLRDIAVGDTVPMQFLLGSGAKALADCVAKPANTLK